MRIAFVVSSLSLGGAERSLAKAATLLYESGHDIHVVAISDSPLSIEGELPKAATIWHCHARRTASPLLWAKVRRRLKRVMPQRVIGWSTYANMVAIVASRPWDRWQVILSERNYVPAMLRTLGSAPLRQRLIATLIRRLYPLANTVTANSLHNVRFLRSWLRNGVTVEHLPNVIDVDLLEELSADAQVETAKGNHVRLLAVGRLVHQKGFDILLRALGVLAKDPSWSLTIVGGGPDLDRLKALARDLAIETRVRWLGARPNPFPYYRDSDIVVVPSRFEGFPNAAMEAMASGKALICTDCKTGPRELTRNGRFGVLVPVQDVAELANAIARLMREPVLRWTLGKEAWQHIVRNYSSDAVRSTYLRVIAG
jgi:glycosyltransferase involved in cell wall biosynthesis